VYGITPDRARTSRVGDRTPGPTGTIAACNGTRSGVAPLIEIMTRA
jgi:hypothetical protein